jgi:vacuolar-type H+-ATPase subunit H
MVRARDILYRFRPAGAPGAAGAAGVPVDRTADLEAELAPVLALLADTEAACDALIEEARQRAATLRARDLESARAVVEAATGEAAAARAAAATSATQAAEVELRTIRDAAAREAEELRRRASERVPGCASRVVELVRGVGDSTPAEEARET